MLQLTSRDEAMLDWMNVVRLADVDAIRWALSAYQDDHGGGPVSIRRANHWIARMAELGYLGRARPMYRDRQIVWPTHQATGRAAPRLFRQTMRHELAVAMVSGRYLAAGYAWARDRRPQSLQEHQTDGVATKSGACELIEVELTPKAAARYRSIHANHSDRLTTERVSKVIYLCTHTGAAVVAREADKYIFRDHRHDLVVLSIFDNQGRWTGSWNPAA
jgi:hypothetical protein